MKRIIFRSLRRVLDRFLVEKSEVKPDSDELEEAISNALQRWEPGMEVKVGKLLSFDNKAYRVIQDHTTQSDWTPDTVPALFERWREISEGEIPEWIPNESVSVGDQRMYNEVVYSVVQSHTTQAGWEPPNVPALWEPAE